MISSRSCLLGIRIDLHLETAEHRLVHLHGLAVEVARHDPDDLGLALAAHAVYASKVFCVVVELAVAAALHEQVLRLVQEDDAALAPLGRSRSG